MHGGFRNGIWSCNGSRRGGGGKALPNEGVVEAWVAGSVIVMKKSNSAATSIVCGATQAFSLEARKAVGFVCLQ